jgi:predicted PurR-regulated permease PerM
MTMPTPEAGSEPVAAAPLPRGLIVLLTLAGATVTLVGIGLIRGIVAPVFLALMLTIAVHPIRTWLMGKGAPGWVAAVAGLVAVYAILIGVGLAMLVSLARFATLIPTYQEQFQQTVSGLESWLKDQGIGQEQVDSIVNSFSPSQLVGVLGDIVSGVLGLFSNLLFIILTLLFMGMDAGGYPDKIKNIDVSKAPVAGALMGFVTGTRQYLLVSTVFGAIVAVIDTALLWALNIPVPLLWGLLAFITNYIPNIGFIIGVIPPAALGLLTGGWELMVTVIILYCAVNFVVQSVIQPKFIGDSVGLATTITFLSVIFWTLILGALGALLAVPLTLLAKALLVDADPNMAWVQPLLHGGPGASPDATTGKPD